MYRKAKLEELSRERISHGVHNIVDEWGVFKIEFQIQMKLANSENLIIRSLASEEAKNRQDYKYYHKMSVMNREAMERKKVLDPLFYKNHVSIIRLSHQVSGRFRDISDNFL